MSDHHRHFGMRLVKAPKLYFMGTGLAAWPLGWLAPLATVQRHIGKPARTALIYGGDMDFDRSDVAVIGWRSLVRAG